MTFHCWLLRLVARLRNWAMSNSSSKKYSVINKMRISRRRVRWKASLIHSYVILILAATGVMLAYLRHQLAPLGACRCLLDFRPDGALVQTRWRKLSRQVLRLGASAFSHAPSQPWGRHEPASISHGSRRRTLGVGLRHSWQIAAIRVPRCREMRALIMQHPQPQPWAERANCD